MDLELERAERIIEVLADYFDIRLALIKSRNRRPRICIVRKIACYLIYYYCDVTQKQIANLLGYKEHSSVSLCITRIDELIDLNDNEIVRQLGELKEIINEEF